MYDLLDCDELSQPLDAHASSNLSAFRSHCPALRPALTALHRPHRGSVIFVYLVVVLSGFPAERVLRERVERVLPAEVGIVSP